ncbi:MinD-like ATPase involved in chromosome partitioning or flagellar assembly [Micromonospora viridifaciens]|uniref:MinD-like ATPase involved in chromosome partitioning or flagellar assembly n=1 Tax=Micromonospora viridifaciens TaxID=1881 RepID=A0A1C4U8K3_MICVI|nr:chromosome partitioning protein [Micromonospora viridifaciens]SCE67947.1 MinD-like ATPase involved in chromosome partitioning or flagellar assembly [Micromonospora viridifaciens]
MVHENADRAHVPGQPQVPERDIEPLWPPDPTDPTVAAPPWAAPQPAASAWPTPPATATPSAAAWPPAPQPVDPATEPAPDQTPPGTGREASPPRAAQPPVDLDLPFTLDHPAPSPAGPAAEPGGKAEPGAEVEPDGRTDSSGRAAGEAAAIAPATSPLEATVGEAAGSGPTTSPPTTSAGAAVAMAPATSPPMTSAGEAAGNGPGTALPEATAGETTGGRNESPWAQPPQRLTSSGGEAPAPESTEAGSATPPGNSETPESPAPRRGPFPPSPGVPRQQPPYENGSAYPPGPVGYGQPGHPTPSPYPPPGPGGATPPPGWYSTAWPQQAAPVPQQPGPPPPQQPGPAAYPEPVWTPESGAPPTAEDFARRRQARPADPVATMGVRAVVNKIGLVRLPPGRHEQEVKRDIEMVRRNFGGLRQVTVVNPKGGAGKTVAILLLAMTFGQKRGGYVLAWDNNETQGTLGMRAQQDFHTRTVRDLLRDLAQFQGAHGRVGDLSQYVRSQGEGMFDVLASDESATGGEMLTAAAFAEIRDVVSRFYKLIFVDTGNNVRAQNWQAAMDATDQLLVTMSARNDSAETAARMLDHLEQSGRQRLVRQAVTVVSMPPSRKEIDLPAIQAHFAARTRAVLLAPYERLIDTGEPIRYGQLSSATRDAWLKIAAAVAEGL